MSAMRPMKSGDWQQFVKRYRSYLNELARFDGDVDTTAEPTKDWVNLPVLLFPYVSQSRGVDCGFFLITGRAYAKAMGEDCDAFLHALFTDPKARGTGATEEAILAAFARHPGTWGLHVLDTNEPALRFWRRILKLHVPDFVESELSPNLLRFRFEIPKTQLAL